MTYANKFTKGYLKIVKLIKGCQSNPEVSKVMGKHIQGFVEYFDDDGLNLLTEDNPYKFGYILDDPDLAKIDNKITINPHYLYQVKATSKTYPTHYLVSYLTKENALNFLKQLLSFATAKQYTGNQQWEWKDMSYVTSQQEQVMEQAL